MANNDQLHSVVLMAIHSFNEKDGYLIKNNLSERCICACFATHLAAAIRTVPELSDYVVDVEYNRGMNGRERGTKRIDDRPITVDLIVHKRSYNRPHGFDNLICIEMKKSTDRRGCNVDEERLQKMTSYGYGFLYQAGFMIQINMKKSECCMEIKRTFYRD